jgi:hypothetical protein
MPQHWENFLRVLSTALGIALVIALVAFSAYLLFFA